MCRRSREHTWICGNDEKRGSCQSNFIRIGAGRAVCLPVFSFLSKAHLSGIWLFQSISPAVLQCHACEWARWTFHSEPFLTLRSGHFHPLQSPPLCGFAECVWTRNASSVESSNSKPRPKAHMNNTQFSLLMVNTFKRQKNEQRQEKYVFRLITEGNMACQYVWKKT